jgi:hypothetical protein
VFVLDLVEQIILERPQQKRAKAAFGAIDLAEQIVGQNLVRDKTLQHVLGAVDIQAFADHEMRKQGRVVVAQKRA